MEGELFGTGDIARLTGMSPWSLQYRIRTGDLPNSTYVVSRRRVFTEADLLQIRALLQTNPELWSRRRRRKTNV